jgi:hypothetical protein
MPNFDEEVTNSLTLNGVTFKTSGNIVFESPEESPYVIAESPLLEKMDGILENGLQMLLKRLKP